MDVDQAKNLKKITKDLASQHSENIMKALKYLRHKYLKRNCENEVVETFCSLNGAKALTTLLYASHKEELFDYVLSILANCCVVSEEARKQVINANGIKEIGHILNRLAKQSIQDRACRLLGNLSKDPLSFTSIQENKNIAGFIVEYLKNSIEQKNDDSVKSAIRTLRYVAKVPECATEIASLKIIPEIVKQIKTANFEIYEPILMLFNELSNASAESMFHQQVIASGLLPIMVKFSSHKSSRLRHQSMLFIVSQCGHTAEQVGNAGAIPILIEAINDTSIHAIKKRDIVEALCHLLYHANNRCRMNRHGGLKCLIDVLAADDDLSIHDVIIRSFLQCLYDDASMLAFQELNIIPCLLDQLNRFVKKCHGEHYISENSSRSRNKIDLSVFDVCAEDIKSLFHRSDNLNDSLDREFDCHDIVGETDLAKDEYSVNSPSYQMILVNQGDTSDVQTSSAFDLSNLQLNFSPVANYTSPSVSPPAGGYSPLGCISPISPSSPLSIASDISVLDDYQDLVYSDHEGNGVDENGIDDTENNHVPKLSKKRKRTSDFKNWSKQRKKSGHDMKIIEPVAAKRKKSKEGSGPTDDQTFMDSIFTILAKYTWKVDDKPISESVIEHIPRYFETFMSFVRDIPMNCTTKKYGHSVRPFYSACKTLCRIASDCECLATIITCDIPKKIQQVAESLQHADNSCEQCFVIRRLCRKILERDLKAVAESRMGQGKLQELMSSSVKDKIKVAQFLPCAISSQKLVKKFFKDLDLITYLLNSLEEDPENEVFIDSARSVVALSKVLGIKHLNNCEDEKLPVKCLYHMDDDLWDVWFVVGEGDKVGARKAALLNADFFRAMFCGNFSETDQSSITVADANLEAFCLIMHYLHCSSIPCDKSVEIMTDHKIILELLHLADKYLLTELQYSLHDQIMGCISEDNASSVYFAASLIQDKYLMKSALSFILVGNIDIQSKVECLQKLMKSDFKSSALNHIQKLLCGQMSS